MLTTTAPTITFPFMALRVYSQSGQVAHLIDERNPFGPTLCGRPPTSWWGLGNANQARIVDKMPTCKTCERISTSARSNEPVSPLALAPTGSDIPQPATPPPQGSGALSTGKKVWGCFLSSGLLTAGGVITGWKKTVHYFDGDPILTGAFFLCLAAAALSVILLIVDLRSRSRAQQKMWTAGSIYLLLIGIVNFLLACGMVGITSGSWSLA